MRLWSFVKTEPEPGEASRDPRRHFPLLVLSLAERLSALLSNKKSSVLHRSGLAVVSTAVFPLGSAAFGAFGARRSDGGGDAVEAGRHPPAGGWTPETDAQRVIAANKLPLRPLRAGCPRRSPPKLPKLPGKKKEKCFQSLRQINTKAKTSQCDFNKCSSSAGR